MGMRRESPGLSLMRLPPYFCYEFASQYVYPFVLIVVQVQRRTTVCSCSATGITKAANLPSESKQRTTVWWGEVESSLVPSGPASETRPDQHLMRFSSLSGFLRIFHWALSLSSPAAQSNTRAPGAPGV